MQVLRQIGTGILFALVSAGLVLGGLVTGLAEENIGQTRALEMETSVPTSASFLTTIPETPVDLNLPPSTTIPPSPTSTLVPPTHCQPPTGWLAYMVQSSDTLEILAKRYNIEIGLLLSKNCLISPELIPGTRIYVPPFPTQTPIPCGAPASWITYYVRDGDTLFRLSLSYRVTVYQLQIANCLGTSTRINVGQRLYVPNVPTSTPAITDTPTMTITPTATATLPAIDTLTPTFTLTPTAVIDTETPVDTPTFTDTPLPSDTPEPTFTFTPEP